MPLIGLRSSAFGCPLNECHVIGAKAKFPGSGEAGCSCWSRQQRCGSGVPRAPAPLPTGCAHPAAIAPWCIVTFGRLCAQSVPPGAAPVRDGTGPARSKQLGFKILVDLPSGQVRTLLRSMVSRITQCADRWTRFSCAANARSVPRAVDGGRVVQSAQLHDRWASERQGTPQIRCDHPRLAGWFRDPTMLAVRAC